MYSKLSVGERVHEHIDEYFLNEDKNGWKTTLTFGAVKKRTNQNISIALRHRIYKDKLYVELAQWTKNLE